MICIIKHIRSRSNIDKFIQEHRLSADYFTNKSDDDYSLDSFISERFETYRLLYAIDAHEYYKEDEVSALVEDFTKYVFKFASPIFLKYLSLTYNINTLELLISEKCTLVIVSFVTSHNNSE